MTDLRFVQPDDDATLKDWQYVHNVIIPSAALSLDEVRERVQRNHLEVAYLGDVLVGCSTVRPPTSDASTATVIARVLAAHRGQGFGGALYARGLDWARALGASEIETHIWASNTDGLRFAHKQGFVEVDRYLLPGDSVPWFELRLS
ncbi:GNAT family N-acetyltransferase [Streptomyces sp. NPDC005408]|uniref:GNAT family N-acetyltransferase n=1 Tax=Streptomyces sp. NPDC005408 TaxID=3155341 RepID=UPI0033A6427C